MDASLQTRAEQLAQEIAGQAETVDDLNDLMRLMMKSTIQRMLDTEMDVHLGRRSSIAPGDPAAQESTLPTEMPPNSSKKRPNRRNGRSKKTVRSEMGELGISTPRDRDGTFEPQLIGKHLVRAALRYVADKDSKAVVRDLKKIYQAATVVEAEQALDEFAEEWDPKYPTISKTWRTHWSDIVVEAGVHGDQRGVEEVDASDPPLEIGIEPLRRHV